MRVLIWRAPRSRCSSSWLSRSPFRRSGTFASSRLRPHRPFDCRSPRRRAPSSARATNRSTRPSLPTSVRSCSSPRSSARRGQIRRRRGNAALAPATGRRGGRADRRNRGRTASRLEADRQRAVVLRRRAAETAGPDDGRGHGRGRSARPGGRDMAARRLAARSSPQPAPVRRLLDGKRRTQHAWLSGDTAHAFPVAVRGRRRTSSTSPFVAMAGASCDSTRRTGTRSRNDDGTRARSSPVNATGCSSSRTARCLRTNGSRTSGRMAGRDLARRFERRRRRGQGADSSPHRRTCCFIRRPPNGRGS